MILNRSITTGISKGLFCIPQLLPGNKFVLINMDKEINMILQQITPMLWTDDMESSIAFYRDILGFQLNEYNTEWGWASLSKDQVQLMLARPNQHLSFTGPNFTGSFYYYIPDVDALWEQLKNTPYVYYPIENFEYGMREFAIKDNNGYILQFGKEIPENEV